MKEKDFLQKYPISLFRLMLTPLIFREYTPIFFDLPHPRLTHLKDLCGYAGYSFGALRTALSRARKKEEILEFNDGGISRFSLTGYQKDIGVVAGANPEMVSEFSLAVFSFQASEEPERKRARKLLEYFGFKYFAQNVYISRRIAREPFENAVVSEGLDKNLFLFDCGDPGSQQFKDKLYRYFGIKKKMQELQRFKEDVEDFINLSLGPMNLGRRLFYLGPVHHRICFENAPPLPENYYPDGYPMTEMKNFFQNLPQEAWLAARTYYLTLEKEGNPQ